MPARPIQLFVPKPVARVIVETEAFKAEDAKRPPYSTFPDAAQSTGRRHTLIKTSAAGWDLFNFVGRVLAELRSTTRAKASAIDPVLAFERQVKTVTERLEKLEEYIAEWETAEAAKRAAQDRARRTRVREKTLSLVVEADRSQVIAEICEDYDLDFDFPPIRAALIAAFHSGARAYREAANDLLILAPDYDKNADELYDKLVEDDKKVFAAAREEAIT